MTSLDSEILCRKYKLGFPVITIYMYKMIDSLQSVFIYFILYNSDYSFVRRREPLLFSLFFFFPEMDMIAQRGEVIYPIK